VLTTLACHNEAGEPSEEPLESGLAGSSGTSGDEPRMALSAACTKLCGLERVLSNPCSPGALIVCGQLTRPEGESIAVSSCPALDDLARTDLDPDCMSQCLHPDGVGSECDPAFASLVDCLVATIWRCAESGPGWSAIECDTQRKDYVACASP